MDDAVYRIGRVWAVLCVRPVLRQDLKGHCHDIDHQCGGSTDDRVCFRIPRICHYLSREVLSGGMPFLRC